MLTLLETRARSLEMETLYVNSASDALLKTWLSAVCL